jgi:Fic-DOC domain mobile mystery protein B
MNIQQAIEWTMRKKFKPEYILSEDFVKRLHKKMFNEVWAWAGEFRASGKNIGIKHYQIAPALKQLNDDGLFWLNNETYNEDEMVIRYKHRIVNIHCFPNGNGRHSRLIADVMIKQIFDKNIFTWSGSNLVKQGETRMNYLKAIREADKQNIHPLIDFARS